MKIPFVAFGNEELERSPRISSGDFIKCPKCRKMHMVRGGKDAHGKEDDVLLAYVCGGNSYLAGVKGRNVMKRFGGSK
jgi:hypothetical protein